LPEFTERLSREEFDAEVLRAHKAGHSVVAGRSEWGEWDWARIEVAPDMWRFLQTEVKD